ncbi:MAG: DUF4956 domain-containing protein [Cyclobacteriaceae bacterium]
MIESIYELYRSVSSTEEGRLIRNLILTAIFAEIVAFAYIRFSSTVSNKKSFAKNFFLISVTTMLVITFIKGSLALSLGLVGALSIIRFRTAIKEPEELAYLFLTVGIGLGFGAGYVLLTIIAVLLILLVIFIKHLMSQRDDQHNLFINFATLKEGEFNTEELINVLEKHTSTLKLKRFEESGEQFEATFNAVFPNVKSLSNCKNTILTRYPGCNLNYVEMENY